VNISISESAESRQCSSTSSTSRRYATSSSRRSSAPAPAIAISTAGASPALAKRMKREIAGTYGEPYARLAVILNDHRGWAKGTLPTYQDRKEFFEGIVNGEPDPIELINDGREADLQELIEAAKRLHGRSTFFAKGEARRLSRPVAPRRPCSLRLP
jgi:hypothetical protein